MSWLETLRTAVDAVRSHRLRSMLTMLGIVIGVAAVIAMVAIGSGARNLVDRQIQGVAAVQPEGQRKLHGAAIAKVADRDAHQRQPARFDQQAAELRLCPNSPQPYARVVILAAQKASNWHK